MSDDPNSMAQILPVVTRLDVPAERILRQAVDANLEAVVIAGYTADGEEYFASSVADGGTTLWLVEKFKQALLKTADDLAEG